MADDARERINAIDVARGTAMLLVFLSHFLEAFYEPFPLTRPHLYQVLTRIASPAFITISGVTLAVLFGRNRARFDGTRDRLIDRGLFLILVGHPLFTIPYYFMVRPSWEAALRTVFMTDTIGAAVIVGALLVTRIGPRLRFWLGAGLMILAWTLNAIWSPPIPSVAWRLKDFLVGDWREQWLTYNFPILAWLGLYIVASAAGAAFSRAYETHREETLARRTAALGLVLVAAALVLRATLRSLAHTALLAPEASLLDHLSSLMDKLPPSPAYLLCYGGFTALMLAGVVQAERSGWGRAFTRQAELFGRNSLAAFLFQFYIYYLGVSVLPRPPAVFLPLYFGITLVLLHRAVTLWERKRGNRLFTIGFPAIRARWRADRQRRAANPYGPVPPVL